MSLSRWHLMGILDSLGLKRGKTLEDNGRSGTKTRLPSKKGGTSK
jgi:hypothetical protein